MTMRKLMRALTTAFASLALATASVAVLSTAGCNCTQKCGKCCSGGDCSKKCAEAAKNPETAKSPETKGK